MWNKVGQKLLEAQTPNIGVESCRRLLPMVLAMLFAWHSAAMPDAARIRAVAESIGVQPKVALAVAWEESRRNTDPALRGAEGEWGRFQVLPATARRACPGLDITTYEDNVRCGLRLLRSLIRRYGAFEGIRRYNGSGPKAAAYLRRVLATIGRWELEDHE